MNASRDDCESVIYEFGRFSVVPERRQLLCDGTPVVLGSRAFDLLVSLVESPERTVLKAELMARVWPNTVVEANNLTVNIAALRRALCDVHDEQRIIRTIPGRGYRFVAELRSPASTPPPPAPSAPGSTTRSELPGIAVLPFANMSGDPTQDHFGDGIAEDIIAELSRNRWLTVIARNSSFTCKGQPSEIAEVAQRFGVRYVLEGSLRKAGSRIRITAQLIDATTGTHLLAERYDRDLADIFAVQDEITSLIIDAVRPALYEAEQVRSMRKHPTSIDAWAAYQRGVWHFSRHEEPEGAEAQSWFQRAIALDPSFAPGYYGSGLVYIHDGSAFIPDTVPDWQSRGEQLALRAVLLDERDSGAHAVLGVARMVRGDHAGALDATQRALAINPNDASAHGTRGATLVFNGRPAEGLQSLTTSLRLSPRDPRLRIRLAHIGLGHYFGRDYVAAHDTAQRLVRDWPAYAFGYRLLGMVLAETDRLAEASRAIARSVALSPALFDDFSHARMPWYRPDDHRRVIETMRRAGWTGRAG